MIKKSKTPKPNSKVVNRKSKAKATLAREPLINEDGDIREITVEDLEHFKPIVKVLPDLVELYKKSRGRPKIAVKAVPKSIRLAADVAKHFEAMGKGWQTKMNAALRELIHSGKL